MVPFCEDDCRDNGGHISTTYSDIIILDTSTPRGGIQINNGAAYTNVGTYVAKLTVVDLAGNRATSSATVSITVLIPEFLSALVLTALMTLLSSLAVAFRRKRVISN